MGFRNLVERNVKKAFDMVKDLAIDVTLTNTRVSHFDFGSGAPSLVASAPVYIKGILVTERQRKDNPAAWERNQSKKTKASISWPARKRT